MESRITIILIFSLCTALPEGWGLPVVPPPDPADSSASHRVRSKRCSCNNQLDSECHYFCHLDIIWVNTPSKTTVYGLGSPLSRRRRSTGRCFCASPLDTTCRSFCHQSSANLAMKLEHLSQPTLRKENASSGVPALWNSSPIGKTFNNFLGKLVKDRAKAMEKTAKSSKLGYR